MAAMVRARDTTTMVGRSLRLLRTSLPSISCGDGHRCASTKSGKSPARLAEVQRLLYQAEERYNPGGGGVKPIPKISLDHVKISYANSGGGSGGQNFNKAINTKVDMRFNVKNALWLDEKVRERIMQMLSSSHHIVPEGSSPLFLNGATSAIFPSGRNLSTSEKNRINKDGDIVISSKKSKAQKSNAEDAIAKLQVFAYQKKKLQAIIDAASYVPPPPSEETVKKISELSTIAEQKRLGKKKVQLQKKLL